MSNPVEIQITQLEERLRLAMLQSDVNTLNELLASELIFTNHLGQVLTKQDDLEAHQSGTLKVEVLTFTDERIQLIGEVAIVTVQAHLLGSYAGTKSEADFRFTRIWALSANRTWQVVAAHSSVVMSA